MEDLEIRELDLNPLEPIIEGEAPKNGCTSAVSGLCCPVFYK